MRRLLLTVCFAGLATSAMAQEGRFADPAPVNFDRPFLFDAVKVRVSPLGSDGAVRNEDGTTKGIPIEDWLANGRKMDGLTTREPKPAVNLEDGKALRELFKDLLPVETPTEQAPIPSR